MTFPYAPLHSDGAYCAVAARYREGQQSDGDCEQSHHWLQSDARTYCDYCRSTSPCNHLNRRAYVPTADPYGDATCNCSNTYCQV